MAIELMDEHEQSELVRTWLRNNLNAILIGILAGIALIVGYYQYKAMQVRRAGEAQVQYQSFLTALEAKNEADMTREAASLRSEYEGTPYAVFAAMRLGEAKLAAGDLAAAATEIGWAREHAKLDALKNLATLRLARVKLAQGEAQAALDLASEVKEKGYAGLAAELRGDALVALNRGNDARAAYEEALTALDAAAPSRSFVQMKRDDLAAAGT